MRKYIFIVLALAFWGACKNDNTAKTGAEAVAESEALAKPTEVAPEPLTDPKLQEMREEGKKRIDMIQQVLAEIDALPALARTDRDLQLMRMALEGSTGKAQSAYQDLLSATKEDKVDAAGTTVNSAKAAEDALNALKRYDAFFAEVRAKVESLKK
jgi:hypothetical protein